MQQEVDELTGLIVHSEQVGNIIYGGKFLSSKLWKKVSMGDAEFGKILDTSICNNNLIRLKKSGLRITIKSNVQN
jgi:hypothetical protein